MVTTLDTVDPVATTRYRRSFLYRLFLLYGEGAPVQRAEFDKSMTTKLDIIAMKDYQYEKGWEKGNEYGMVKGREEGRAETLRKMEEAMRRKGFVEETIINVKSVMDLER